jgi:hypothetical protein
VKSLLRLFQRPRAHRDRSQRVRLLLSDGAQFDCGDEIFPVLNLSETGIGLLAEKASPQDRMEGTLLIGEEKIPVQLEVVRRSGSHVGARFSGDLAVIRGALRRQFTEEIRATEMSEVNPAHLAADIAGQPRWFYAPGNYELFFVEQDSKILKVEMEWNGRVVAVKAGEPLRTGVIEGEERDKPTHAKSSLVRWEAEVADRYRAKAIRIVENIPGLDPLTRGKLIRLLRNAD